MDNDRLKALFTESPIKWAKESEIYPEILEERHVKVAMPPEKHINHVNIIYAGSIFTLAELSAGALFFATYGFEDFAPIVSEASITYQKPIKGLMYVEESFTREEADALIAPVLERGKGSIHLEVRVRNEEGEPCAVLKVKIYCMPLKK